MIALQTLELLGIELKVMYLIGIVVQIEGLGDGMGGGGPLGVQNEHFSLPSPLGCLLGLSCFLHTVTGWQPGYD